MAESIAAKTLRELIAKYPKAGARTLARIAYRENPTLWPNATACLTMVRGKLGVAGKGHRKNTADKTQFREPKKTDWAEVIPEPVEEVEWGAVSIPGPCRALILSDIHIPFHDPKALQIALEYGLEHDANLILLNGDIFDHYSLSRWEKDPRKRNFPDEVKKGKLFLKGLRGEFPKAQIWYKHGNHEERYEKHMASQSPDLLGIPDFEWVSVFGLDEHDIKLVDGKKPIALGKLNVLHGHEYTFNISSPVNPARGLFLRARTHVLAGHFHQSSSHSARDLEQKVITAWSTGCLCKLHPDYRPLNEWQSGFAFVVVEKDGAFHVDNLRILNGRCW